MKMKSFLIPALALALAGCANEELETIGSGTIPAVPSGQTILFSNNTALTIGDADGVQTRAMGWTEVTDKVNSACWLEMDVKPTPSGNDVYIKSGEEDDFPTVVEYVNVDKVFGFHNELSAVHDIDISGTGLVIAFQHQRTVHENVPVHFSQKPIINLFFAGFNVHIIA